MRLPFLLAAFCVVTACVADPQVTKNRPQAEVGVNFGSGEVSLTPLAGGGPSSLAQDFMDLTFAMESGRRLPVFTRFEGPVTVALTGAVPPSAAPDLLALIARLKAGAGIDISPAFGAATITVEFTSRAELRRLAPQAACFVVPNVTSLEEYRRKRGSNLVDWSKVTKREQATILIPADTSPQEVRDCLHEELAQALGPLNDLYRLPDSVFNDDNFHSVLTSFDMKILRATYAPALSSGMTEDEVAAQLPAILGDAVAEGGSPTPAIWVTEIETALGRRGQVTTRRAAAERALAIATRQGWRDGRLAFSHFALARISAGSDPALALDHFALAADLYVRLPGGALQVAHIDMQRAAMALAGGLPDQAVRLSQRAIPVVRAHDNAALLATLMLIQAEALEQLGNPAAAAALRMDSQVWARYGFGPDSVVKARMRDIAAVAARASSG